MLKLSRMLRSVYHCDHHSFKYRIQNTEYRIQNTEYSYYTDITTHPYDGYNVIKCVFCYISWLFINSFSSNRFMQSLYLTYRLQDFFIGVLYFFILNGLVEL